MKGIVYMCIDESTVLGFETADLYNPIPSRVSHMQYKPPGPNSSPQLPC